MSIRRSGKWCVPVIVGALFAMTAATVPGASAASGVQGLACGGAWKRMSSPNTKLFDTDALRGVWASSATDVWAVGGEAHPLIEHHTVSGWTISPVPELGKNEGLHAVSGSSAADVWAVGEYQRNGGRMLALHWDGSSWTPTRTPKLASGAGFLRGVSAGPDRPTWAVGYEYLGGPSYEPVILRWTGTKWVRVSSPDPGDRAQLFGVVSVSDSLAWAVGYYVDADFGMNRPLVERWDGTAWSAVLDPALTGRIAGFGAVTAPTPTTVVAAGFGTFIASFDGSSWSTAFGTPGTATFRGLAPDGAGGAWLVGLDNPTDPESHTLVEEGTGTAFTRVRSADPAGLNELDAVAYADGVGWAVGERDLDGSGKTLIEYHC